MKQIAFLFIMWILTACCDQTSQTANSSRPKTAKNTFENCFAKVDTTKNGQSISCSGGTFKLINDKYVLWVSDRFPVQFDSCYTVTVDSLNGIETAQLIVYANGKASLANCCTDLIICNNPTPTQTFICSSGQLIIGYSDPTKLYGNNTQRTTVLIKNLVFVDKTTGEKIEIKNELLWKVLDLGTPG